MTIAKAIAENRKKQNMTQEALARQLGVTNQAVSKWELDQACPDIQLLPMLADIFGISLDALFGRESRMNDLQPGPSGGPAVQWPDDNELRVVVYIGHRPVKAFRQQEDMIFRYEGPALNVHSQICVTCQDVGGDVDAGTAANCANVAGNVDAGTYVNCGNVEGSVDAGTSVNCGNVGGDVDAGTDVCCGNVGGDVDAGCTVQCGEVRGDIDANGPVTIRKF